MKNARKIIALLLTAIMAMSMMVISANATTPSTFTISGDTQGQTCPTQGHVYVTPTSGNGLPSTGYVVASSFNSTTITNFSFPLKKNLADVSGASYVTGTVTCCPDTNHFQIQPGQPGAYYKLNATELHVRNGDTANVTGGTFAIYVDSENATLNISGGTHKLYVADNFAGTKLTVSGNANVTYATTTGYNKMSEEVVDDAEPEFAWVKVTGGTLNLGSAGIKNTSKTVNDGYALYVASGDVKVSNGHYKPAADALAAYQGIVGGLKQTGGKVELKFVALEGISSTNDGDTTVPNHAVLTDYTSGSTELTSCTLKATSLFEDDLDWDSYENTAALKEYINSDLKNPATLLVKQGNVTLDGCTVTASKSTAENDDSPIEATATMYFSAVEVNGGSYVVLKDTTVTGVENGDNATPTVKVTGGNVTLNGNTVVNKDGTAIPTAVSVTGGNVTAAGSTKVYATTNGVTVANGVYTQKGSAEVHAKNSSTTNPVAVEVNGTGTAMIQGGAIYATANDTSATAVGVQSNGDKATLEITGGKIDAKNTKAGGGYAVGVAVKKISKTAVISNATINANAAKQAVGVEVDAGSNYSVYMANSNVTVTGGTVTEAKLYGVNVFAESGNIGRDTRIKGGTITVNATMDAYGVYQSFKHTAYLVVDDTTVDVKSTGLWAYGVVGSGSNPVSGERDIYLENNATITADAYAAATGVEADYGVNLWTTSGANNDKGVTITAKGKTYIANGVYVGSGTGKITMNGVKKISAESGGNTAYAVSGGSEITIDRGTYAVANDATARGEIYAVSADAKAIGVNGSDGLIVLNNMDMTVKALDNAAYGVYTSGNVMFKNTKVDVYAAGDYDGSTEDAYGVYISNSGNFVAKDSFVTAKSVFGDAYGVWTLVGNVTMQGNTDGSGVVGNVTAATNGYENNYSYACGVIAMYGKVTMSDMTVNVSAPYQAVGVYTDNAMLLSGAYHCLNDVDITVKAQKEAYGVFARNDMKIVGGTISAETTGWRYFHLNYDPYMDEPYYYADHAYGVYVKNERNKQVTLKLLGDATVYAKSAGNLSSAYGVLAEGVDVTLDAVGTDEPTVTAFANLKKGSFNDKYDPQYTIRRTIPSDAYGLEASYQDSSTAGIVLRKGCMSPEESIPSLVAPRGSKLTMNAGTVSAVPYREDVYNSYLYSIISQDSVVKIYGGTINVGTDGTYVVGEDTTNSAYGLYILGDEDHDSGFMNGDENGAKIVVGGAPTTSGHSRGIYLDGGEFWLQSGKIDVRTAAEAVYVASGAAKLTVGNNGTNRPEINLMGSSESSVGIYNNGGLVHVRAVKIDGKDGKGIVAHAGATNVYGDYYEHETTVDSIAYRAEVNMGKGTAMQVDGGAYWAIDGMGIKFTADVALDLMENALPFAYDRMFTNITPVSVEMPMGFTYGSLAGGEFYGKIQSENLKLEDYLAPNYYFRGDLKKVAANKITDGTKAKDGAVYVLEGDTCVTEAKWELIAIFEDADSELTTYTMPVDVDMGATMRYGHVADEDNMLDVNCEQKLFYVVPKTLNLNGHKLSTYWEENENEYVIRVDTDAELDVNGPGEIGLYNVDNGVDATPIYSDGKLFIDTTKEGEKKYVKLSAAPKFVEYDVTFDPNFPAFGPADGAWVTKPDVYTDNGDTTITVTCIYGEGLETLPTVAKTGYTFAGWSDGTNILTEISVDAREAMTLTAQWTAIYYNLNDTSVHGDVEFYVVGKDTKTSATVEDTVKMTIVPDAGYKFVSLSVKDADGNDVVYTGSGDTYVFTVMPAKNVTATATFEAIEYNVSVDNTDTNGVVRTNVAKATVEDTVTVTVTPNAGWKLESLSVKDAGGNDVVYTGSNDTYTFKMAAGEVTVKATFSKIPYPFGTLVPEKIQGGQVEIYVDGDDTNVATIGDKIIVKLTPRDGYHYGGLKIEGDKTTVTEIYTIEEDTKFAFYMIGEDVKITPTFTPNTYYVAFKGNGATSGSMSNQTFTYDEANKALTTKAFGRTGYTFAGWNTKANGSGTSYANEAEVANLTTVKDDTFTLYAQWTANKYTVTFYKNTGDTEVSPTSINETYDAKYVLPATNPTRTGYSFAGWYTEAVGGTQVEASTTVAITAAQKLYAHWTANKYTVTFDAKGGVPAPSSTLVTYDAAYGTLPTVYKTGYTFVGWYNVGLDTEFTAATIVKTAESHTLYAKWTPNQYTVSFDAKGGSACQSITVTFDAAFGTLPTTSKTGYTFAGWYTEAVGGTQVEASTTVGFTSNTTLYAHWTENTATLTYNANGHGTAPNAVTMKYTTETNAASAITGVTGYTFASWNTKADGTGTAYAVGATVNAANVDPSATTLYAQWTENTATLTYDANGYGEAPAAATMKYTTATNAASAITGVTGYTFTGWNTKADGTGTAYAAGAEVKAANVDPSATTLYAQWTATVYTITYNLDGGENNEANPVSYTIEDATITLANPTKSGYTFKGWYTDDQFSGDAVTTIEAGSYGDVVLFAKWSRNGGGSGAAAPAEKYEVKCGEGVTVDKTEATKGTKVTVKVAEGYENVVVKDAEGNTVTVTNNTFKMPESDVTVSVSKKAAEATTYDKCDKGEVCVLHNFTDVETNAWYHDGVHYCLDNGLMNGVSETEFAPNAATTRAMIWAILGRLDGQTITGSTWADDAKAWAVSAGISDGTDANGNITREQFAAMLYRFAQLKGYDVSASSDFAAFGDAASVSTWATDAMQWAVGAGIINGDNGNLKPTAGATRAEVATMLMRFCEAFAK